MGTVISIIIIPFLHTMVSIIVPGIAWKTLLNHRLRLPDDHGTGYILQIIALGILFNTVQFAMALLLIKFHACQQMIAIGKYAMDLVLIIFASLKAGHSFTGELKKLARVWAGAGGKLVFTITVILGLIAILHFPHVEDSGQLLWTNKIIQTGFFPVFKRFAIGYSALIYFVHFIVPEMSLPTLAAGFKLPLLLLAGLVAGWVVNRLQLKQIGIFRTLFFFIMTFSIFGLYGMLELGKDSVWGVLFSISFVFSLVAKHNRPGLAEPLIFFICACLLGTITIPYLTLFMILFILHRYFLAGKSLYKRLFPIFILLIIMSSIMLMPVKLDIVSKIANQETQTIQVRFPADGQTPYLTYFFTYRVFNYQNTLLILLTGTIGILLLPWWRNHFQDAALKSLGLFPFVTAFLILLYIKLYHNGLPLSSLRERFKLPLTPFDLWNLMKDIPQWYNQIIFGIFVIILLDGICKKMQLNPKSMKNILYSSTLVLLVAMGAFNMNHIIPLFRPAYFFSYGGNQNHAYALIMEKIHRNQRVRNFFIFGRPNLIKTSWLILDIRCRFPKMRIQWFIDPTQANISSKRQKLPCLVLCGRTWLPFLEAIFPPEDGRILEEITYDSSTNEGLYLLKPNSQKISNIITKITDWFPNLVESFFLPDTICEAENGHFPDQQINFQSKINGTSDLSVSREDFLISFQIKFPGQYQFKLRLLAPTRIGMVWIKTKGQALKKWRIPVKNNWTWQKSPFYLSMPAGMSIFRIQVNKNVFIDQLCLNHLQK